MNVGYIGALKDYSGYGEASRHHIAALRAADVEVNAQVVSFTRDISSFGKLDELIREVEKNKSKYRIKLLHVTPNIFHKYTENGKYNVGFMYWETDKVPEDFAEGLKLCDEIWTGSQANVQAIKKAGVDKPVFVFPQAIEVDRGEPEPYLVPDFDGFLFYSIFEWTERKDWRTLIRAYLEEFEESDNVGLLIKTYFQNFTHANQMMITNDLKKLKSDIGKTKTPPLFLYKKLMNRDELWRFHATGDCLVSATHGEGWGVPQVEAMLMGNPIISTPYGGIHEYLEDGKNAFLPSFEMVKVHGMDHSAKWYDSKQNWAQVSLGGLKNAMRIMYENNDRAKRIGLAGQKLVKSKFNPKVVGSAMAKRLKEIEVSL